jgi:hypothetical protein
MSNRVVLTGVLLLAMIAPYAMLHPLSWFALATAGYATVLTALFWFRDRESQRTTTQHSKTIQENPTARESLQAMPPKEAPVQRSSEEDEIYEKLRNMNILRRP